MKDRGANPFQHNIELIPGNDRFRFSHLVMEVDETSKVESRDFGNFKMPRANSRLILKMK